MDKKKFREELAKMFVKSLNAQKEHWAREWACMEVPFNPISKTQYKGVNTINLWLTAQVRGISDPRWVTMIQIKDKKESYHKSQKWTLRKGSKAAYVEYWGMFDTEAKKSITWDEYEKLVKGIDSKSRKERFRLFSKYIPVFSASDITGIEKYEIKKNESIIDSHYIQKIASGMGVEIRHDGGDRAFYRPSEPEAIHLPEKDRFKSQYSYDSTAAHELAHSTAAENRLNRKIKNIFGSEDYAFEELIAEMTSAFLGIDFGADVTPEYNNNHKAYIQSWIKAINDKPDALVKAIKEANKVADYMEAAANKI